MAPFREALNAAVTETFCTLSDPIDRSLALGERWYNNANLPGLPSGPTPLGQGLRAARDILCGQPPVDIGEPFQPLLDNGQCPGTIYRIRSRVAVDGVDIGIQADNTGPGPLSREKGKIDPSGEFDIIRDANNAVVAGGGTTIGETYDITNLEITANSGPDDCGGTDPVPPEPYFAPDWTSTPDVTYDPPGGGPALTVPVGLVFAPIVADIDGTLNVPVRVDFDTGVQIDANLNLNTGNVVFNNNVNIGGPTEVEDPTRIEDPDGPEGRDPDEEESLERAIIGVYVRKISISPGASPTELDSNTPGVEFRVPRIALVTFNCEVYSSPGLGYSQDVPVKYDSQVIMCPVPWGAKSVSVTPEEGVVVEFTLIRAESERQLLLRAAGLT